MEGTKPSTSKKNRKPKIVFVSCSACKRLFKTKARAHLCPNCRPKPNVPYHQQQRPQRPQQHRPPQQQPLPQRPQYQPQNNNQVRQLSRQLQEELSVKAVMRAATKVELLISAIDLIVNKTVQARVTPKNISALSVIKSFILVIPFFTVTTL